MGLWLACVTAAHPVKWRRETDNLEWLCVLEQMLYIHHRMIAMEMSPWDEHFHPKEIVSWLGQLVQMHHAQVSMGIWSVVDVAPYSTNHRLMRQECWPNSQDYDSGYVKCRGSVPFGCKEC